MSSPKRPWYSVSVNTILLAILILLVAAIFFLLHTRSLHESQDRIDKMIDSMGQPPPP